MEVLFQFARQKWLITTWIQSGGLYVWQCSNLLARQVFHLLTILVRWWPTVKLNVDICDYSGRKETQIICELPEYSVFQFTKIVLLFTTLLKEPLIAWFFSYFFTKIVGVKSTFFGTNSMSWWVYPCRQVTKLSVSHLLCRITH